MDDAHNLERFVFGQVCAELREGRKCSHGMWFIFPQIAGLGHSSIAVRFAIPSREEAGAYLAHDILGARLRQCTQLVNDVEGRSIGEIFGYPDDLEFHSSMTLFASVAAEDQIFNNAVKKYFSGKLDARTTELLES